MGWKRLAAWAWLGVALLGGCVVVAEDADWGGTPTGSLRVENETGYVVAELYVVPVYAPDWGQDQLSGSLGDGEAFTLDGIPPGTYDVGIQTTDGTWVTEESVDIYADGMTRVTFGPMGAIRVFNDADGSVEELYITPQEDQSWGENLLPGADFLEPGAALTVTGMPVGTYDTLAVMADGAEVEIDGVLVQTGTTQELVLAGGALLRQEADALHSAERDLRKPWHPAQGGKPANRVESAPRGAEKAGEAEGARGTYRPGSGGPPRTPTGAAPPPARARSSAATGVP